jgi:hypothetical protein
MFEKVGRLAEAAATHVGVSRRGFLGRVGQGALALTGVLGGLFALPRDALAAGSYVCCTWQCKRYLGKGGYQRVGCYPPGFNCSFPIQCNYSGHLVSQKSVSSCTYCK